MSIAVSAVVVPSRHLRRLLLGACASLAVAAFAMLFLFPTRFLLEGAVAFAPLFAACLIAPAGAAGRVPATVRRIDISGVGRIRLTVQQGMESVDLAPTLVPGATVWPACMLLRLRTGDGATLSLLLLPDSVSGGAYRALAVALRALARAPHPDALPAQIL